MGPQKTTEYTGEYVKKLIAAIILAVYACLSSACSTNSDTFAKTGPKSNESRIVQNNDGSYTVETWRDFPHWQGVGRGNTGTLEQARKLKNLIDPYEPRVVE